MQIIKIKNIHKLLLFIFIYSLSAVCAAGVSNDNMAAVVSNTPIV